jgi:mitochondrial intermembrane space import and assembly protein 40
MQECFREHPDVYGAELEPDEEEEGGPPASLPDGEPEGKPESTTKESAIEKTQSSEGTETVPITEKGSKATSATSANYLDYSLNKGTKPSS